MTIDKQLEPLGWHMDPIPPNSYPSIKMHGISYLGIKIIKTWAVVVAQLADRTLASGIRGLLFESSHQQFY